MVSWLLGWHAGWLAALLPCLLASCLFVCWLLAWLPACADLPGCLASWLPAWQAALLICCLASSIFCMILHLPACMFLCLCLGYAFVISDSNFDFSDFSLWKSYVPITSHLACFCFWLPPCMRCTTYMYGCGQTFLTFHFNFSFGIFF